MVTPGISCHKDRQLSDLSLQFIMTQPCIASFSLIKVLAYNIKQIQMIDLNSISHQAIRKDFAALECS